MKTYKNCRYGTIIAPADAYIGGALDAYGEYSQIEANFLCSFLKPGDTVVEAGAHVGTLTVAMAQIAGLVLAYEPQAEMFEALKTNTADMPVKSINRALSSHAHTLRFNSNPGNTGGVSLGDAGEHEAVAYTLDKAKLEAVALFKIDVEGMEVDVLTGARETIERCRPVIYCENDRPDRSRALFDLLFALGYRVWRHEPFLFNPDNFKGETENIFLNIVSQNLIAIPEEREAEQISGLTEVKPGQWAAVCRFGGLGDNLIAAAPLADLVRQGNRVEVITNKHAGAVFENNPYVAKLSICEDGDQPGDGGLEWQKWFARRSHEYSGGLHHLSHSIETNLALVRAQTAFWWPERLRRYMCNRNYLEISADICGTIYAFPPLFYPSRLERAKAVETKAKMGPRVIGWALCGSRLDKVYPYSAMAIARLIRELDVPVMMVGAPGKDFEVAKDIQAQVIKHNGDDNGLHLAMSSDAANTNWPIRRALAQALSCDLVIGPDTGIMWAAAMEPVPKIMLLSHASPENITKHWTNTITLHADQRRVSCYPCHLLHDTIETCHANNDSTGAACISDISVETIVQQARAALA